MWDLRCRANKENLLLSKIIKSKGGDLAGFRYVWPSTSEKTTPEHSFNYFPFVAAVVLVLECPQKAYVFRVWPQKVIEPLCSSEVYPLVSSTTECAVGKWGLARQRSLEGSPGRMYSYPRLLHSLPLPGYHGMNSCSSPRLLHDTISTEASYGLKT